MRTNTACTYVSKILILNVLDMLFSDHINVLHIRICNAVYHVTNLRYYKHVRVYICVFETVIREAPQSSHCKFSVPNLPTYGLLWKERDHSTF